MIAPKVLSVSERWFGTPEMAARLDAVIAKAAMDVAAGAAERAPVDTGLLRSSIAAARVGEHEWHVVVGAEYGVYVEMGTRKMAAEPYLGPAIDAAAGSFHAAVGAVING